MACEQVQSNFYRTTGKRLFDIAIASIGLIVLAPVVILIAAFIRSQDKGPVFFSQDRVGMGFDTFRLHKFRTMVVNADLIGLPITKGDDLRITRTGRALRQYKLDELPQLLNVLKGDMSVVGPRPEVEEFVAMFRGDYEKILTIRPGITDFATLKFKNEEEILNGYDDTRAGYTQEVLPAKIELYMTYLDEMSFATDVKIIFETLWRIVARESAR